MFLQPEFLDSRGALWYYLATPEPITDFTPVIKVDLREAKGLAPGMS